MPEQLEHECSFVTRGLDDTDWDVLWHLIQYVVPAMGGLIAGFGPHAITPERYAEMEAEIEDLLKESDDGPQEGSGELPPDA